MKQRSIFLILVLAICSPALSQENNEWLIEKLKSADTILLVSHELTAGVSIVDSAGKRLPLPKLTIAGKPNYAITRERQVVTGALLDTLITILARPFEDRQIKGSPCFMPHHAIFLLRKGKTSYFDICFGCRQFGTSKDLRALYAFDDRKWDELERFFLKLGFTYELSGNEP